MNGMKAGTKGFTLIELMIVVAVVAILAAIAYPSYSEQVRKTARKEAAGKVLEMAGRMERIRSQQFKYQDIADEATKRYSLAVDVPDGGATYTIDATPTGDQVSDACGTLSYANTGEWTFSSGTQDLCL